MRLATFNQEGGARVGVVKGERVHAVAGIKDTAAFIMAWMKRPDGIAIEASSTALAEIELLAPVWPLRRNLFCVGWNYRRHFEEGMGKRDSRQVTTIPARPTLFTKATTTINAPFGTLPLHGSTTAKLDWEVELAVVIGEGGCNIIEEDALSHVFGYCIANDVSARDLQQDHGAQWFKGKSLDGTCPLGPVVVTRDEITDPQALDLECRVNGVTKQKSNTRYQVFSVSRIIAELSQGMTLLAGDIILTGTPDGVGNARNPPEYLGDGDVVECEIERIGVLRNTVRAGTATSRLQELALI